jgi:hypothetical protein
MTFKTTGNFILTKNGTVKTFKTIITNDNNIWFYEAICSNTDFQYVFKNWIH